jgi:lipopolysaccharide biosynthesis glycosyltransferase
MIYIGYDRREHLAAHVCRYSIAKHCPTAKSRLLRLTDPDVKPVFHRPYYIEDGQFYDGPTGAPFSTEFSFSRFLVPHLAEYHGWHVFVDADFLFRADVTELFAKARDEYAVMVVKHQQTVYERTKMDGVKQTAYARKNWSSLVLWNASHPLNTMVTPEYVQTANGLDLHGFAWLPDEAIGELPLEWNYLVGYNQADQCRDPKAVHFTLGGPWFGAEFDGVEYADEWKQSSAAFVAS